MNNRYYDMLDTTKYAIFVDGAAPNNQGGCIKGGIGIAIYDEMNTLVHTESITVDRLTNNAELELMALVEGLELASDGDTIYSDSDFCVKGFNEWINGWKARGWRKSNNKPVAYRHLWLMIDELRSRKFVHVVKVRAHARIEGNDKADELAVLAAM